MSYGFSYYTPFPTDATWVPSWGNSYLATNNTPISPEWFTLPTNYTTWTLGQWSNFPTVTNPLYLKNKRMVLIILIFFSKSKFKKIKT
ncbi:unnamed protein product [Brachionus calyciflorus]|uniref:Uncharacterized protein n=1 Tax=Brachionus calyciflorus TaxID=104777 RepID=A0A813M4N5_9BILA|nr:unnamed protein product [Brachionus calyciflorus]